MKNNIIFCAKLYTGFYYHTVSTATGHKVSNNSYTYALKLHSDYIVFYYINDK